MKASKKSGSSVAIRVAVGAVLLAQLMMSSAAQASQPLRSGDPPFLFGASYVQAPRAGEPIWLLISYSGRYDASAVSEMHIDVPRGLQVVEGDTERRAAPSYDRWDLKVRALHPGRYEIHGVQRTTAGNHVDEAEFILPFEVRPDRIVPELFRSTRLERIQGGQRFRYAYDYLVPLRDSQVLTQKDIEEEGGKPAVLRSVDATCATCGLTAPTIVPYRVLVDEQGGVIEAETLPTEIPLSSGVVEAARSVLQEWRFRPAHARGLVTRDRVDVQVVVH